EPLTGRVVSARTERSPSASTDAPAGGAPAVAFTQFPSHTHSAIPTASPERLSSRVSLTASPINAVFVSGGPLTRFDHEIAADDLKTFQQYRPERILVLTPAASMDRQRQLWSSFKGNSSGETGLPKGKISSGDLSALFILKTILDVKIIESGW